MPITLGQPFPPTTQASPPHLSIHDTQLFLQVRDRLQKDAETFYFDVGVGVQPPEFGDLPSELLPMASRLRQKRIDLLIKTRTGWTMVEFRHNANSSAIGRLLLYNFLWFHEFPESPPVRLIVVTDRTDDDIDLWVKTLQIEFWSILPPPETIDG